MPKSKPTNIIETVERECYVDLTADDVRVKGEELAHLDLCIMQEDEALKSYAKQKRADIEELTLSLHKLSETVRQRRELRMVAVDIVDAGEWRVNEVRRDTGEVLRERAATDREKQMQLPKIGLVEPDTTSAIGE